MDRRRLRKAARCDTTDTELSHVTEFYDAINDRKLKTMANIPDYAGPLIETILLGNLAVWKGGKVKWDAKTSSPTTPASPRSSSQRTAAGTRCSRRGLSAISYRLSAKRMAGSRFF